MKKSNACTRAALAAVVACLGLALPFGDVFAQRPQSVVVGKGGVAGSRVTYYDFHSDRTNPATLKCGGFCE